MVADLLRVQALLFLATPCIALPEVMMSRALDFRRQAIVNLLAAFAGAGTALGCALAGYGVWTLAYAPIAMFWTRAIGLTVEIGRAHVCTPVTNAQLVGRLMLEKKQQTTVETKQL